MASAGRRSEFQAVPAVLTDKPDFGAPNCPGALVLVTSAVPGSLETLGLAILNLSEEIDLPITLKTSHYLFTICLSGTVFRILALLTICSLS